MESAVPFVPAEFWGIKVPPNKAMVVGRDSAEDDEFLHTYHLSQVALGPEPVQGRHVVFIEYEGQKSVIGAVTPGVIEQFQIDFPVNCEVKLSHSGKSDVYITGYTTRQFLGYDSSEPEDSDDWGTDSDEEPAALAGQQLPNGRSAGGATAKRRQQTADAEVEEEESDEEEDSDDEGPVGRGDAAARLKAQAHQFSDMDDDDDDDDDDEYDDEEDGEDDEDEDEEPAGGAKASLSDLFAQQAEDDSDDEGDDDDDDEDEDDDEDDEEEDEDLVPALKAGDKRPLAVKTAVTPHKKAKTAAEAPASTPASPGSSAQYQADLIKFLKTHGATKLAVLGSQVKRVPGLPKMKKFLEDRPAVFKVDVDSGTAALA